MRSSFKVQGAVCLRNRLIYRVFGEWYDRHVSHFSYRFLSYDRIFYLNSLSSRLQRAIYQARVDMSLIEHFLIFRNHQGQIHYGGIILGIMLKLEHLAQCHHNGHFSSRKSIIVRKSHNSYAVMGNFHFQVPLVRIALFTANFFS